VSSTQKNAPSELAVENAKAADEKLLTTTADVVLTQQQTSNSDGGDLAQTPTASNSAGSILVL
jgi:hypothetical protein